MTIQFDVATRNARLDAIEQTCGPLPTMRWRSGAKPADCAAADSGIVLATAILPSDWMLPAAAGSKAKNGTWQDPGADASGVIGHFRVYDSGGACRIQGSVTVTGGGGDMTVNSINANAGQPITVTGFTITDGNA